MHGIEDCWPSKGPWRRCGVTLQQSSPVNAHPQVTHSCVWVHGPLSSPPSCGRAPILESFSSEAKSASLSILLMGLASSLLPLGATWSQCDPFRDGPGAQHCPKRGRNAHLVWGEGSEMLLESIGTVTFTVTFYCGKQL